MAVEETQVVDQLFELAVVLGAQMNRRLADSGLTPARGEVIWLLHRRGQLTQRELSDVLDCTPRNVTGLVDALESAGFVTRTKHPTDRRAVLVSLTTRGETLAAGWGMDRDDGTARLFAGTSRAELATFATVLDRVLTVLRTTMPEGATYGGP
ncbi:MarR family winged helix-turn-helix transcriptional regulator [Nonomuraea sp. NPDC049400]|uniref:MarR family winged helix-turn-helix transcriptional regulator n=1 Tax=Nonomuraea sp. NPDC049400 TaxID=3364352 RepID=UPI00378CA88D